MTSARHNTNLNVTLAAFVCGQRRAAQAPTVAGSGLAFLVLAMRCVR
jgi:hypothetical protein